MSENNTNKEVNSEVTDNKTKKVVKRPIGGGTPLAAAEKPDDFMGSISRIVKEILQQKWLMSVVLISSVISVILSTMGPRILGQATTELFNGVVAQLQGTGRIDFSRIGNILLFVLAIYFISALFSALEGYIMTTVTENVTYSLRQRLLAKINRMPMKYFESRPYGEVLSRITNDIDTLGGGLSQSITQILTSVLTMLGITYMMFSINVLMALIVLVVLPVSIFLIRFLMKRSQKFFQRQQRSLGIINGQIEEVFAGQNIVKAFNQEEKTLEIFTKENDELKDSAWKSQFFSGIMCKLWFYFALTSSAMLH
ncbi:ABC transporter permease [Fundicoccus culcitae]|uniref:ABC transporter ATP-binding protein n=1 Tax=Fundicoccus culcitae TaxID=2969821 RepID=A0ABY5P3H9_9LACT|nr:ABC transporter ATP-binding protein [Fundicoccus culcitae]UUX32970.1 ABC transporter ATP-binding protein [Fundicoccus culcitae]